MEKHFFGDVFENQTELIARADFDKRRILLVLIGQLLIVLEDRRVNVLKRS